MSDGEQRLTQAIDDAGALSDILTTVFGADDAAADYIRRKFRENANELNAAFLAFCNEVNMELADLKAA